MRYPTHEHAPAWPGYIHGYYWWEGWYDLEDDRRRLHEGIASDSLYLVWHPGRQRPVVIEAYPANELPTFYRHPSVVQLPPDGGLGVDPVKVQPDAHGRVFKSKKLNPLQHEDAKDGRLIALQEVLDLERPLREDDLVAIRAGDKAARRKFAYYNAPPTAKMAEYRAKVTDEEKRQWLDEALDLADEMAEIALCASGKYPSVAVG